MDRPRAEWWEVPTYGTPPAPQVIEREPAPSGILDHRGRKLHRPKEPVGFRPPEKLRGWAPDNKANAEKERGKR